MSALLSRSEEREPEGVGLAGVGLSDRSCESSRFCSITELLLSFVIGKKGSRPFPALARPVLAVYGLNIRPLIVEMCFSVAQFNVMNLPHFRTSDDERVGGKVAGSIK